MQDLSHKGRLLGWSGIPSDSYIHFQPQSGQKHTNTILSHDVRHHLTPDLDQDTVAVSNLRKEAMTVTDIPMVGSLSASERETVVSYSDDSEFVHVFSCIRRDITKMEKHPAFTLLRQGFYGSTKWAEFQVKADEWNPASGGKRKRNMSEAQRKAISDRMKAYHSSNDDIEDDNDEFDD